MEQGLLAQMLIVLGMDLEAVAEEMEMEMVVAEEMGEEVELEGEEELVELVE